MRVFFKSANRFGSKFFDSCDSLVHFVFSYCQHCPLSNMTLTALSTFHYGIVSLVHFGFFMCRVCPLFIMTLTLLSTQRFKARRLTFLKGTGVKNTETPHRPHLLKWEQVRKTTGVKKPPRRVARDNYT
jgi:hypothetical protein